MIQVLAVLLCSMHAYDAAYLHEMPLVADSKSLLVWVDSQAMAWSILCLHAFGDLVTWVLRFVYAKLPIMST